MVTDSGRQLLGTGRHLTDDELFAWTRLIDASRLVEELIARNLADNHSMTTLEYEILVRLDGADGRMRMTTLAEQCVSSKSRLTHAVDRLEDRGWIRRETVADDGRGVDGVLTDEGGRVLATAAVGHAELVREHVLGLLDPAELPVVSDVLDRMSRHLRELRVR